MNRINVIVVLALLAISTTTRGGGNEQFHLVPYVASLCQTGCSQVCQTIRTLCLPSEHSSLHHPLNAARPVNTDSDCDKRKGLCDAACNQTCSCVSNCGPDCDAFEQKCREMGLPALADIFCPIQGDACDDNCVTGCPQDDLINILQESLRQMTSNFHDFIVRLTSTRK